MICAVSGDTARAAAYAAALPLLRAANVPFWVAHALAELGDALHRAGDVTAAVPLLDEAVEITRGFGSARGSVAGFGERAHAALTQDDPEALAAHFFTETIAIAQRTGVERIVLGALAGLAGVALALGQPQRAVRLLGAVEAARKASGAGRIGDAWACRERIEAAARTSLPNRRLRPRGGRAHPSTRGGRCRRDRDSLVDWRGPSPAVAGDTEAKRG